MLKLAIFLLEFNIELSQAWIRGGGLPGPSTLLFVNIFEPDLEVNDKMLRTNSELSELIHREQFVTRQTSRECHIQGVIFSKITHLINVVSSLSLAYHFHTQKDWLKRYHDMCLCLLD
jgi:hypothetical protein